MTNALPYIGLAGVLIGLSGCRANDDVSKIQTEPISLLRLTEGSDETEAPRHIQIRPEQKAVSVFYGFDDTDEDFDDFGDVEHDEGYENHELEAYEVTEETIDIGYDGRGLSLTDIDNRQYEDEEGNIYALKFYTEDREDD